MASIASGEVANATPGASNGSMPRSLVVPILLLTAVTMLEGQPSPRAVPDAAVRPYRDAQWTQTDTMAGLTRSWRNRIEKTVGAPLADKGEPWNAGCVISPGLAARRFVLLGSEGDRTILVYEHGGFVAHQHAVCFTRSAMGAQTVVAHVEVQGITRAADIRAALAGRSYRSTAHY
jgi:hypothetical protein